MFVDLRLKNGYTTIKLNIQDMNMKESEFLKVLQQARRVQKVYYTSMDVLLYISLIIFLYWSLVVAVYIFGRFTGDFRALGVVTFGGLTEDLGLKRMAVIFLFTLFILGMNFTNMYGYAVAKILQVIYRDTLTMI